MRLIPPKRRAVATREDDATKQWAKGLHQRSRSTFVIVAGNLLMLLVLVGGPLWRGQARARATWAAHAAFASCLLGAKAARPFGIGAPEAEAELLATQLLSADRKWPARCTGLLRAVAPESAIFILPGVKQAELRVREAARVVEVELRALSRFKTGARMPARPLLALAQLREMIRAQSEEAGVVDLPLHSVLDRRQRALLSAPAELPIYASQNAALALWGDDLSIHTVALDSTGLSYLEARPGAPYRRARIVRPASLRGLFRGSEATLLVWATPEQRCSDRSDGCRGKTTGFAVAPAPLLELPDARFVAAHLTGRPDRSLALVSGDLHMTVPAEGGAKSVQRQRFAPGMLVDSELPPILPEPAWPGSHAEIVLFEGRSRVWALSSDHDDHQGTLSVVDPEGSQVVTSFAQPVTPWVTGCAEQGGVGYAAGDGATLSIGRINEVGPQSFAPLALATRDVIHESDPRRDRVQRLCRSEGALAVVLTSESELVAVWCEDSEPSCRSLSVGKGVSSFAALSDPQGVLLAYAGEADVPQIFVRKLDLRRGALTPARIPSPCWAPASGLCGQPILERLGARVLLGARQGTDLLLLESGDDGVTWTKPSVL